jgi:TonB-linked SusC/RagA family outer membrane protein
MRLRTWRHRAVLGLLAVIAVLGASFATARAQKGKGRDITGAIVDPSGAPITGATVTVQGTATPMTAQTDANGAFKIAAVPQTNLTMTVTADGYEPQQVEVIGGKTALQLQLVLVKTPPPAPPETRVISGVVVDGKRNPIAGATVSIANGPSVVTEADGTFTLIGVTTADVSLDVTAGSLPTAHEEVPAAKGAVVVMLGEPDEGTAPIRPTSHTLSGVIKETDTGEPLIGATVIVTGTDLSAITDENGQYVIEGVPAQAVSVEISADQHETKVDQLNGDQDTLDESIGLTQTEQIVIEGRAPVIVKQNLANGASVVSDKDLNRVSAPTLDAALQGKLAGANMQFNSGAPGGGAQLRLRGISTINGQSSPLYVIDGVIVSNVAVPSGANAVTGAAAGGSASNQDNPVNRIADINPNDIENVEVLKGASAAALYGSKAANGVVIITTKRGHNGQNTVNVTQRFGTAMLSNEIGSRHFGSVQDVKDAYGDTSPLVQAYMDSNGQTFDHEKEITQVKLSEETIASAAGGTDKGNYYGSVLVHDEPGIVIGTYYKKQTGRVSLGYDLWDRVKLGVTANLIHSTSDRGLTNNDNTGTSLYVVLSGTPNFVDLRPKNGVYPANPAVGSGANPMQTVALFDNTEDVWRLIGGATAQVDAWHDDASKVTILGNFGADSFDQKNNIYSPPELIFEPITDGLAGTSINATTTNFNYNTGVGALWDFKPKGAGYHSALSAGATYESVDLDSVYVTAQNLTGGGNAVDTGTSVGVTENRLRTRDAGLYAQEEVALLDDKLSLLGGILGERSSLNGNTGHYYLFPKFAGTYEIPALKDKLDVLRARAAFGEAGNRPNYGQKFTPLNATTNIDGNAGLSVGGTAGSPDIQPERQREIEVGLDAEAKNDRAVLELTFYNRRVSDLLLQRSLATSSGFTTEFFNGGALRNRGVELALQVTPVEGTVDWTTRGIFTLNRSSIRSLPVPAFDITVAGFGTGLGAYRIERGRSATQLVTTDADGNEVVLGDGEPDFRVGWSNELKYKAFTLTGLLDWQQGSKIVNLTRLLYDFGNVSPDGDAAAMRLASFTAGDVSPYVEDASFVKIREISLTYDFPEKVAKQLGPVSSLELQLSGRNLATFSPYSGLDPEVSNFGSQPIGRNYDVAPYPPSRSYWISLSAGL